LIQTDSPHLGVVAFSHPGESGKNNEDRFSVTAYRLERGNRPSVLAAIADGIGGHQAGEVAAEIAIQALLHALAPSSGVQPVRELRAAVIEAARAVSRASRENPEREGMGSTLSVAWILDKLLYLASVGDSRVYLQRHGRLHQLTVDHTWIQEALEHDIITPDEAHDHPNVHVLRRHLGGPQEPEPDMRLRLPGDKSEEHSLANQGLRLEPGDLLLLCSDGLTDLVSNAEIQVELGAQDPMQAGQRLVDLARERGGFDNITLVLLSVPGTARRRPARPGRRRARFGRWLLAVILGSLLLVLGALAGSAAAWWFGWGAFVRLTPSPAPASTASAVETPPATQLQPSATRRISTPTSVRLIPTPTATPQP
jgi:serine/threonine protein phosphatase PrpC